MIWKIGNIKDELARMMCELRMRFGENPYPMLHWINPKRRFLKIIREKLREAYGISHLNNLSHTSWYQPPDYDNYTIGQWHKDAGTMERGLCCFAAHPTPTKFAIRLQDGTWEVKEPESGDLLIADLANIVHKASENSYNKERLLFRVVLHRDFGPPINHLPVKWKIERLLSLKVLNERD